MLDADSGQPRRSLDEEQELFGGHGEVALDRLLAGDSVDGLIITGTEENRSLMVPYEIPLENKVELGVAALSGTDGSLLRLRKTGTGKDGYDALGLPVVATEKVVIIRPMDYESTMDESVTAMEAKAGKVLWDEPLDGRPFLVDGETLVGGRAETFNEGRPASEDWDSPMTVVAWETPERERYDSYPVIIDVSDPAQPVVTSCFGLGNLQISASADGHVLAAGWDGNGETTVELTADCEILADPLTGNVMDIDTSRALMSLRDNGFGAANAISMYEVSG